MSKPISLFASAALTLLLAACPGGATTGTLVVSITGLPDGASGSVLVSGSGFSQQLTATTGFTLPPGSYSAAAQEVTVAGYPYAPTITGSPATLSKGSAAGISVVYFSSTAPTTGSLAIAVSGLPSVGLASISVSGPGSYTSSPTASGTLNGLLPGGYSIAAQAVSVNGTTYSPTVSGSPATVVVGGTATASVVYVAGASIYGSLQVNISGLPAGANADVSVSGPFAFSAHLTESNVFTGLQAGSYTVSAAAVTTDSVYVASVTGGSPAVVSLGAATTVDVVYSFSTGAPSSGLDVTFSGLPANDAPSITIEGPNAYFLRITSARFIGGLAPGDYTVTGGSVQDGSQTYDSPSLNIPVGAGETAEAHLLYVARYALITVDQTNGEADLTFNGPNGYSMPLNESPLAPVTFAVGAGAYSVTAPDYTQGAPFTATITGSPVTAVAGQSYTIGVTYTAPPPTVTSLESFVFGDADGGGPVIIHGTNFVTNGSVAYFDGVAAGTTNVGSDGTQLQALAPPHDVGKVDITVKTAFGTSATSAADLYDYFTIDTFPLSDGGYAYGGMTMGPDGNVWFTEQPANRIGVITDAGVITEYDYADGGLPTQIAVGPDGNLWFSSQGRGAINRIPTAGVMTEFSIGANYCQTYGVGPGAGAAMLFTAHGGCGIPPAAAVGSIDTSTFEISAFALGSGQAPQGIVEGPDGNAWVGYSEETDLTRVTSNGVITTFPATHAPGPLIVGPDMSIWYGGDLDSISTAGVITPHPITYAFGPQQEMAYDPAGAFWFGNDDVLQTNSGYHVARYDLATGREDNYLVPDYVTGLTIAPNGDIWMLSNSQQAGVHDGSVLRLRH